MNNFWDKVKSGMNQFWDKTLEGLGKVNSWIPLSTVLIAGLALLGVVLILAICGCVKRKCLVPSWLIWTYFTFATIIIFAHTGNDVAAWVAAMEVPVLVVLLSYILRTLIRRRPLYVYTEKEVYARHVAQGRVVTEEQEAAAKAKKAKKEKKAREVKVEKEEKIEENTEEVTAEVVEAVDEKTVRENAQREAEKVALEAEKAKLAIAEQAAREAREKEQAAERAAAERAARDVIKPQPKIEPARPVRPTINTTAAAATMDMPTVNPIPGKAYEPTREPTIVATPVSQTIPGLKIPSTPIRSTTTSRPLTTTSSAVRPTSTFGRPATTTTTTTPSTTNAFTSMYNPRIVKTTTTSTNTNTNRVDIVNNSRTVNGNTTSTTTIKASSTGTSPRSTQDIMSAIERLRASMKK